VLGATACICNHSFLPRFIDRDSVVLDLGANRGDFAHAMIERFGCRVISAEPIRELYDAIPRHPLLQLVPFAIGGKNQLVPMNLFSSRCASVLGPISPQEDMALQPVEMITLGELRCRVGAERLDLLKLDIEGAEVDLFNACSDDELRSVMQITVEFHDFLYPELQSSVTQIRKRMHDIGFWVLPFSLDNTNVLFVNRKIGVGAAEFLYLRTIVRYGKGIRRRLRRNSECRI
jgi:FkbM family methyltransferase